MARRASGAARIMVPGVRDALAESFGAFAAQWNSERYRKMADDLNAGRPVQVTGHQVWRALFDERHPRYGEQFMRDDRVYTVSGADTLDVVQE
jgi:hypothetical protein